LHIKITIKRNYMCKNTLKTTKNIWKEKTKLKGKIIIQKVTDYLSLLQQKLTPENPISK
jgi:hypothetical protein